MTFRYTKYLKYLITVIAYGLKHLDYRQLKYLFRGTFNAPFGYFIKNNQYGKYCKKNKYLQNSPLNYLAYSN